MLTPPKHSSISNRLARFAADLDARDREMTRQSRQPARTNEKGNTIAPPVTVILDGAHIRAVPAAQNRLAGVTVGKVLAADGTSRRVGLAPRGAALIAQGWQPGSAVTVISDGEPALRNLVKAATGGEVTHILDLWHLSIRVRPIEQTVQGMEALETPAHPTILDAAIQAERLRHLLWNGYADEASRELFSLLSQADAIAEFAKPAHQERARKLWGHCNELKTYIENNEGSIINYSRRYRSKEPVASAPAERMCR
jgi:hypothetical protein